MYINGHLKKISKSFRIFLNFYLLIVHLAPGFFFINFFVKYNFLSIWYSHCSRLHLFHDIFILLKTNYVNSMNQIVEQSFITNIYSSELQQNKKVIKSNYSN